MGEQSGQRALRASTRGGGIRGERPRRQRVRRGVQIVMLMLFPATFFYFSPVVSAMGASEGIVTGSLLLFGLLFVSSAMFGRLFCSWVCPGGALGEVVAEARPQRLRRDRVHWIKYLVWAPWVASILLLFTNAGGVAGVDPLYATEAGFSTTSLSHLIAYLLVVVVFLALMIAVGKRAPCHTVCWMAPFMVLGRSVGNALRVPALRLAADSDACVHCGTCTAACPMGLEVQRMVERASMDHTDCILCAECIDTCPKHVIAYRWKRPGATAFGRVHPR